VPPDHRSSAARHGGRPGERRKLNMKEGKQ
jgi:hypothetical protein